jgi:hypothetical protein
MRSFSRLFRALLGAPAETARRRGPGHRPPALEVLEDRLAPSTTSVIRSNFNGTAIGAGDSVWFNSVAKVSGLGSSPVTLSVVNAAIDFTANGTAYHLPVPDATVTFSPTAPTATTSFANNTWTTIVPSNLGGNVFLAGVALPLPSGLPGGVNPVTWQAQFESDTPGLSVNWQWAAAVYTSFGTDPAALGVKPVDSNQLSAYKNSDHAGTPENFKTCVTGGARGGGGSNFTGSYSATAQVQPSAAPPPSASLSGSVVDEITGAGLSGVTVTLSWTNAQGQQLSVTTTTDASGSYSFTGLQPGTYTLTESPSPIGYTDDQFSNQVGSLGGSTGNDTFSNIVVTPGANGAHYNFENYSAPT